RGGMALHGAPGMKLVTFVALALLVHGPLSPFLPTAFEATLLYYARLYPAWLLALVGTLSASVAESVNYRLVDWATGFPKLARLAPRPGGCWAAGSPSWGSRRGDITWRPHSGGCGRGTAISTPCPLRDSVPNRSGPCGSSPSRCSPTPFIPSPWRFHPPSRWQSP